MKNILVVGNGLAGMSAAIHLAELGSHVTLISKLSPDRSQSVMAAGGINAALNTKSEEDSPGLHAQDTLRAGAFLADEQAALGMTAAAPELIRDLAARGVVFSRDPDGEIDLRSFGGQKKKRTAFAKSGIGRQLVCGISGELRRHIASKRITARENLSFISLILNRGQCCGITAEDTITNRLITIQADAVILASGGLGGLFGKHTGSQMSDGSVSAAVFRQGVMMANLEMIQYHPTTIETPAKRMLISEAARGEGGRLFTFKDGKRWYFMEEWFPEGKNLMPRDVVSRAIYKVCHTIGLGIDGQNKVGLELEHLSDDVVYNRLKEVTALCRTYLRIDPKETYIPVYPGIHYFMGGIYVDRQHRTSVKGVYAAGECACQYHGANRLGGNSTLGAIYGGRIAAETAYAEACPAAEFEAAAAAEIEAVQKQILTHAAGEPCPVIRKELQAVMNESLGIIRCGDEMDAGLMRIQELKARKIQASPAHLSEALALDNMILLAQAVMQSARERKESRGAHARTDYPETDAAFQKTAAAFFDGREVSIGFEEIGREFP